MVEVHLKRTRRGLLPLPVCSHVETVLQVWSGYTAWVAGLGVVIPKPLPRISAVPHSHLAHYGFHKPRFSVPISPAINIPAPNTHAITRSATPCAAIYFVSRVSNVYTMPAVSVFCPDTGCVPLVKTGRLEKSCRYSRRVIRWCARIR
jgi:hypothetical protein